MTRLIIEPHYLPSLEYFTLISQVDEVLWDVEGSFQKQTYRNRCYVLTANGVLPLIVPVHFQQGMPFKEVKVDYRQSWVRQHWGAVYSAYGKSPFFDYFADYFRVVFDKQPAFLLDLNHEMITVCLRLLGWDVRVVMESDKSATYDLRNDILAKKSFESRKFYHPQPYTQNFGNTFAPNLSLLDLLFCQGPESGEIVKRSVLDPLERFSR
jgi:hypothetical protein